MIVSIHQPDFLPWLGFFDRWKRSDIYIVLDDVQFLRRGWHHRDRIKTANGPRWLTVPVCKKDKYNQLIKDVKIDNSIKWRRDHLKTIELNYKKAPKFDYCFHKIAEIYNKKHSFLIDFNMDLLKFSVSELRIKAPFEFASSFSINKTGNQRLIELVLAVGGKVYLTGTGSRDYLDEKLFLDAGIKVRWQEYVHPVYEQLHGEFIYSLSSLDYLMMRTKDNIFS